MKEMHSRSGQFVRVAENLYRYTSSGVYYARFRSNGKEISRSLNTTDRAIAKRKLAEELENAVKIDTKLGKMTLDELIRLYDERLSQFAPKTSATRRSILKCFKETWPHGLQVMVPTINTGQLEMWLGRKRPKVKNATYNEYARFLRHLFDIAVKHRVIAVSPAASLHGLRPETPIRSTPTWEQFQSIVADIRSQKFNAEAEDSADLVAFMGLAGIGTAECSNLLGEHIDFAGNRITLYRQKTDIEFALSGKMIIHKGQDISLSSAIDQFQDVRHIFNVPEVPVHGSQGEPRGRLYFGEYVLFHDVNARRGALTSPIIVDLRVPNTDLIVKIDDLVDVLVNKYHYRESSESPTRRGEFRRYSDTSVEIFYRHNVYPFGVIGGRSGELVCLASGGLSGRVGNTLEGIIRVMFDFFGCEDALVLDEGYDTFHLLNPNPKKRPEDPDHYKYDNEEILDQVASFTLWRMQVDLAECREEEGKKIRENERYKLGPEMWRWPLNVELMENVSSYCKTRRIEGRPPKALDAMAVEPHRSQIRAVVIFAVRR